MSEIMKKRHGHYWWLILLINIISRVRIFDSKYPEQARRSVKNTKSICEPV